MSFHSLIYCTCTQIREQLGWRLVGCLRLKLPRSDVFLPPQSLNAMLNWVMGLESHLIPSSICR